MEAVKLLLLLLLLLVSSSSSSLASAAVSSGRCAYADEDAGALICSPRTLADLAPMLEEEGEGDSDFTSLEVRCTQQQQRQQARDLSSPLLPEDAWRSLSSLRELRLLSCRVGRLPADAFPGMHRLERLAVGNRDPSVSLEVDRRAFRGLDRLEHLDLSGSGLWSLPQGALCHLPALRAANLSHNRLTDAADIGLSSSSSSSSDDCRRLPLESLDLSGNSVASLRGDLGLAAPKLRELRLSGNGLSLLGDGALRGLARLEVLDLSDNRVAALPTALFSGSQSLKVAHLQNNSLSLLFPGAFDGLDSLVVLNLSRNAIDGHLLTGGGSFRGLTRLQVLDLSRNWLSGIRPDTFAPLGGNLRILHLEGNGLRDVPAGAFSTLSGLQSLVLSGNRIRSLPLDALGGLASLTSLSVDGNGLGSVADGTFASSPLLESLSLEENELEEVPAAVGSLQKLRTLDLGENKIRDLREGDFSGLGSLYGLRLSGNELTSIRRGVLSNATGLHVLNLARNDISEIEQGAFERLSELRALRLDNNELTDINGVVSGLGKLQWLNVSSNALQWFDYAFVPNSLEWLDLHDNQVEELGNYYKLRGGFSLRTLDVSQNKVEKLTRLSLPGSLEVVDLSGNRISEIEDRAFEDKGRLAKVVLTDNAISKLSMSALHVGDSAKKGTNTTEYFIYLLDVLLCSLNNKLTKVKNNDQTRKIISMYFATTFLFAHSTPFCKAFLQPFFLQTNFQNFGEESPPTKKSLSFFLKKK